RIEPRELRGLARQLLERLLFVLDLQRGKHRFRRNEITQIHCWSLCLSVGCSNAFLHSPCHSPLVRYGRARGAPSPRSPPKTHATPCGRPTLLCPLDRPLGPSPTPTPRWRGPSGVPAGARPDRPGPRCLIPQGSPPGEARKALRPGKLVSRTARAGARRVHAEARQALPEKAST